MDVELAYIGMGANLDKPINQVLQARHKLSQNPSINVLRTSSLYKTSPVGYESQPDFINAVVEVETTLSPTQLLSALQKIESEFGRQRDPNNQNAPRRLDLDILYYGDRQITEPDLTIPHPRIAERLFVLTPLHELAPELAKPHLDGEFSGQRIHRLTHAALI